MNCTHVEKLLPLYVEGDLEAGRVEAVRAHLASCPPCRQLVAGYEGSQGWLRSYAPPDFDDAFFDELRGAVRSEIARERARPTFFQLIAARWRWQPVWAVSCALLLILGGLALYVKLGSGKTDHRQAVKETNGSKAPSSSQRVEEKANAGTGQVDQPKPRDEANKPRRKSRPVIPPTPEPATELPLIAQAPPATETAVEHTAASETAAMPAMLRIEIQTADPKIRIIWFTPKDANPPSSEHGTDFE